MPRTETRARQRRVRFNTLCSEFDRSRGNPETFWGLLRRIANSDVRVWAVAEAATVQLPLDEAELAMVAQAAAPQLVRMTPGTSRLSIAHRDWARRQNPLA